METRICYKIRELEERQARTDFRFAILGWHGSWVCALKSSEAYQAKQSASQQL